MTFPGSLRSIESKAFELCEGLEAVTVPESANVADDAFDESVEITRI